MVGKEVDKMAQFSIPCAVYRGGTSRGVFFQETSLPESQQERDHIFLQAIDAYNLSQIDGLGSGTSHSSKVVVIDQSNRNGIDIDYTFFQIGIGEPIIDDHGTCGNLMAAVAAFAIDSGFVHVNETDHTVWVSIYNTNINRNLKIKVPVINGKAKVTGKYYMPGVVKPGSKYEVYIKEPGGAKMGKTFPIGIANHIYLDKNYNYSFLDVVNPFIFVKASDFNLTGKESYHDMVANEHVMTKLNSIRDHITKEIGFARTVKEARELSPAVPKIAIVAPPDDYTTISGHEINGKDVDILAKMVSMERLHRTFAGSGLYNLAAASLLPGTIPQKVTGLTYERENQLVRIGHPDGIAEVYVSLNKDQTDVTSVGLDRTARLILKGEIYVPWQSK